MSLKKFLLILGVIVIILAIVGFAFYTFINIPDSTLEDREPSDSQDNLFPFGPPSENIQTQEDTLGTDIFNNILGGVDFVYLQLSTKPIAGAVLIDKDANNPNNVVRYTERATGHIYEIDLEELTSTRISNTTIPKLYTALFGNSGFSLVGQYLDEDQDVIKSFFTSINVFMGGVENTSFFAENISSMDVSPDGSKVSYILTNSLGSDIFVSNIDGSGIKRVYTSGFSDWLVEWVNNKTLLLTSRPSAFVEGVIYKLDSISGSLTRILGAVKGLTGIMSPSEDMLLFSRSTSNESIELVLKDLNSEEDTILPMNTLPEKCVWSSDGEYLYCSAPVVIPKSTYPDSWYKGEIFFTDSFWIVDTQTGVSTNFFTPSNTSNKLIDGINLILNKDNSLLLITNKRDFSLWGLRLE